MIGDPAARYREDPVRIIRVVRFAAKLGFEIEPKTRAPINEMVALLDNVPASRTFDEMIKLLQTGHALASIEELKKQGLHRGVFPVIDVVLDEAQRHDGREKFVKLALADTDRRVGEGKPVAPSFMLACMLWHDVLAGWSKLKAQGESSFPALQQAVDTVFDSRIGDISGRGKLAADMREIWLMQPRFERRTGSSVMTLVEQPRFRAGFDFLRLRGDAGEVEGELANWWEDFSLADENGRRALLDAARSQEPVRRVRGAPRAATVAGDDLEPPESTNPEADPARKRRRRRRKPAGGSAGGDSAAPVVPASDA
jgi:poly(A) polymerase